MHAGKDLAWAWVIGVLGVLLVMAATMWVLTMPAVFKAYYSALGISPWKEDAQTIVNWLASSQAGDSINPQLVNGQLRPKEVSHFGDVRRLFGWFPVIAGVLLVLSALAVCAAKPSRQTLLAAQARGFLFWLVIVGFAGGLSWWDWETFFAWIHYPFFGATSWRLPNSAYSLKLFPASFWRLLAGILLLAPLLILGSISAILIVTGKKHQRQALEEKRAHRAKADLCRE
jgi:uncharacterized membrane protein